MEPRIQYARTSDGVSIAYATIGAGPPVIYVPGWVSHLEMWWEHPAFSKWLEIWAERCLFIMYDKRGSGLSDRNVGDYSLESWLLDLEAVASHAKAPKFALYGASEGGPLSIAYAAHHPRSVSRLALYGTYASPTNVGREAAINALVALVRAEWGLGSRTLADVFMPGASPEERDWFVRWQQVAASAETASSMLLADTSIDVRDLLKRVKCPTLVVHATRDLVVPFEFGREIAGGIPNARLLPIESDRHVPTQEKGEYLTRSVADFLLEGHDSAKDRPAPDAVRSGFATILFTDIENSAALRQRLGDDRALDLLHVHDSIVRDALKTHQGSEIKHTGDGIMCSFSTASSALEAAIAIQRAISTHVQEHPDPPLGVYVGLNAGEPIAEEKDLFGTSVDLAKRICDHAKPGQILVSDVIRQLAAGKGFLFSDCGDTEMRGFEDPVRLYEVRWQEDA